jgi:hypothetical protein
MKVAGFTFIKNAITYDYPIVEAILSILPICDEFVVAVGRSDDDTLGLIKGIGSEKIRIIETVWDETLRTGGRVLALETDKAFAAISTDCDWAFYIQGDEVVHERYLDEIYKQMQKHQNNPNIDGLLFNYQHFFASFDYVGTSAHWYTHEIRVIKNNPKIYSYRDAQGFRKNDNEKLQVAPINAFMYHYGWVKDPRAMQRKQESFNKYWHDDQWIEDKIVKADAFDYSSQVTALERFDQSHPAIMLDRINRTNWTFEMDPSFNKMSAKDKLKQFLKRFLGLDFSYKNYVIKR